MTLVVLPVEFSPDAVDITVPLLGRRLQVLHVLTEPRGSFREDPSHIPVDHTSDEGRSITDATHKSGENIIDIITVLSAPTTVGIFHQIPFAIGTSQHIHLTHDFRAILGFKIKRRHGLAISNDLVLNSNVVATVDARIEHEHGFCTTTESIRDLVEIGSRRRGTGNRNRVRIDREFLKADNTVHQLPRLTGSIM